MSDDRESRKLDELEKRVQSLEGKILLATGAFAVLAVWMGVTSFYTIPKEVGSAIKVTATQEVADKINLILSRAQRDADAVNKISSNGTINVGGVCLKPRTLVRCFGQKGGSNEYDHLTWVENKEECNKLAYRYDYSFLFLGQC